jgi:murein DD-endopeptidase MepM/ murein hydrolase activator NlpD
LQQSRYDYRFPVTGCSVSYGPYHHDYPATDVFAARGCSFVAVVAGTVDEVTYVDRWNPKVNSGATRGGLSVSIVGVDGVRYYGSHLSAIAPGIAPGVAVRAGQLLGRVGDSGDARGVGTHVHFGVSWPTRPGVWWVRRGMVSPYAYLNSWRRGGNASPRAAVARLHRDDGDVPPCRADC